MATRLAFVLVLAFAHACAEDTEQNADAVTDSGADAADAAPSPCADHQAVIDGFRIGLEQAGLGGRIGARLVDARPVPPQKFLNDWTIELIDADGSALADSEITSARSFMPVHGHDGTFPPIVTPLEEPGRFQVDDLNLWMRGPWRIELNVSSSAGVDYIEIPVCIAE